MGETAENIFPAKDRRNTIRYTISADVRVITPKGFMPAEATEISVYGVRLRLSKRIYPGMELGIIFKYFRDLSIRGRVVWVLNTTNDLGLNFYEAGIFIDKLILRNMAASGLAARTEVMPDILLAMKEFPSKRRSEDIELPEN